MTNHLLKLITLLLFISSVSFAQPMNDIVERQIMKERQVLPYHHLREADIMWERRIWRLIDVREKMNHAFMYPENPFFEIMTQALENGELQAYSAEDDRFTFPLDKKGVEEILFQTDTIPIIDPVDLDETITIVQNQIFYEDIKRFRLKEIWFFDEQTASLQVRILGIAPLKDVTNENGDFMYEKPLFWLYYPELRQVLARHQAFVEGNDVALVSWEDVMERRYFSSTIYKSSNVRNERLKDFLSGVDLLLEADRIKRELFNYEHDLWTY